MKNDFEILQECIDKNVDKEFFESLTYPEQILFMCCYRDTVEFNTYLIIYKLTEFFPKFVKFLKNYFKYLKYNKYF